VVTFLALDFETANQESDSACAVAVVRVEGSRIVDRFDSLIRPPSSVFTFTWVHGIEWRHVEHAPPFAKVWPQLCALAEGAAFFVAHNAPFDRRVLGACTQRARVKPLDLPFVCTMQVARRQWGIRPTRLPDVCARLRIPLQHHDARSDAEACAKIMIAALEQNPQVVADLGKRRVARARTT